MYYIAYLLSCERWRYVYARKFGKARLAATNLYGPMKNGKPDFERMARLVRSASAFPIIKSFRDAMADAGPVDDPEDQEDAEVATLRLMELEAHPAALVSGAELEDRLRKLFH